MRHACSRHGSKPRRIVAREQGIGPPSRILPRRRAQDQDLSVVLARSEREAKQSEATQSKATRPRRSPHSSSSPLLLLAASLEHHLTQPKATSLAPTPAAPLTNSLSTARTERGRAETSPLAAYESATTRQGPPRWGGEVSGGEGKPASQPREQEEDRDAVGSPRGRSP